MTASEFDKVVQHRIRDMQSRLWAKSEEYSTGADKLHNFKATAETFGGSPAEVLWGFLLKHLTSIRDMAMGTRPATKEAVDEKIGDAINYLVLLEALFLERFGPSEPERRPG